jgi:hypothetical protein
MKKTALGVYALAVCFVTVICFVITLGIALYSAVQIARPEFTLTGSDYTAHQTNDAYWNGCSGDRYCGGSDERKKDRPGEAELTQQRTASYTRVLANEQRDGAQVLVKSLIVVFIDMAVFAFHWFIARRASEQAA